MLCPRCKVELRMSDRQNVEIDYCPDCRGIWLDRGELDKIIDRSLMVPPGGVPAAGYVAPAAERAPVPEHRRDDDDDDRERYRRSDDDHPESQRRNAYSGMRKRGWLGDILDFD